MKHLILFLLLPLLVAGCTLTLGNDDDDATSDDDDATSDDDDATADDDDATSDDDDSVIDDDDDDDDVTPIPANCDQLGSGSIWFSIGEAMPGSWTEGELTGGPDSVSVEPDFGPAFLASFYMTDDFSPDGLLDGISGPGRLWYSSEGTTWKGSDGVLAAETDAGAAVAFGNRNGPPPELEELGFTMRMEPDDSICPTGLVDMDGCGDAAALPMQVTFSTGEVETSTILFPGDAMEIDDWAIRLHRSWHMPFVECDDYPSSDWTWSVSRL